jgi:WD40 repeat protein
MNKAKRYVLYLILSLIGLAVGQHLHSVISSQTPEVLFQVGEDLVAGKMSPDGRYLAGVGREGDRWFLQVWNNASKEVMSRKTLLKPPGRYPGFDWSPDGEHLAISAGDHVWVFQVKDGSKKALLASAGVRAVQYDGSYLIARTKNATIVWRGTKTKPYWRLDQQYLLHSAVDGESGRLATACFEDGVRVFDLKRKSQLGHFQPGAISCGLQFDARGLRLTSGFRTRANRQRDHIVTFDLESGRPAGPALTTPRLFGFQFSDSGRTVLSRQQPGAFVWNVEDARNVADRKGPAALIDALSADGRWVATIPGGGLVSLWSTRDPEREYELRSSHPVSDVRFGGPGRLLVVGGHARLWKVPE